MSFSTQKGDWHHIRQVAGFKGYDVLEWMAVCLGSEVGDHFGQWAVQMRYLLTQVPLYIKSL
jgi:hypothetical protein